MDLTCSGLAHHSHECTLGVASNDRVIDHDNALAGKNFAQRIELETDAKLADGLRRLDEGAPDVGVLDQALAERDP